MKTRETHERSPQLLQKHDVLPADVTSAKFLHNESCGFFLPHFSPNFLPPSLPTADKGQRKGGNGKNQGQEEAICDVQGFFFL